jgi:hypothetical protein
MSTTRSASRVAMTAGFTIVLVLALLLWVATVANTITIRASDAAGNALSQAFGALMAIALWVLLAILLTLAAVRGGMPVWMRIAAVVLVPAAGAATIGAIEVMSQATEWPVKWPLAVPIVAPGIVIALSLALYGTSFRALATNRTWGGVAVGVLALLAIAPWPLLRERGRLRNAGLGELQAIRAAKRARWTDADRAAEVRDFEVAAAPDAALYSLLPFTEPGDPLRDRALAAIHALPQLQSQIEELVRAGNTAAVREVPSLGAEPTLALCEGARESVVFYARRVRPDAGDPRPDYARYARDVEFYMPTIEWLTQRGCSLGNAFDELEATARAYTDSPERARFLERLAELRRGTTSR